jgi:iron complex transport system substrate-binding protein
MALRAVSRFAEVLPSSGTTLPPTMEGIVEIEELARRVVDSAFNVHRDLGPGLLESVYEAALAKSLEVDGFQVERQKAIAFTYKGITFDEGFRADLLINSQLLLELKSVERTAAVHGKQVLTYLRLLNLPLGFLVNFGAATFKEGIQRVVNNHKDFRSSHLRLHE